MRVCAPYYYLSEDVGKRYFNYVSVDRLVFYNLAVGKLLNNLMKLQAFLKTSRDHSKSPNFNQQNTTILYTIHKKKTIITPLSVKS